MIKKEKIFLFIIGFFSVASLRKEKSTLGFCLVLFTVRFCPFCGVGTFLSGNFFVNRTVFGLVGVSVIQVIFV